MKKNVHMFLAIPLLLVANVNLAHAGTVTGKVDFTGTAPTPEKISMDADPICAGLHAAPVFTESAVVNPGNTLRNVFVYVKQGVEGKTFEAPKGPVVFDQKGCHYTPHVFGLQVNQTLEVRNSDATLHNVHGQPPQEKEFNLGMPIQGMKLNRKFTQPEIMVKFKCDVHPWMNAYAGVLPHPFFSVTGETGTYEIKNLPAGSYVIEAWHEKYGTKTQNVTVDEAGTQAVDFSFGG